MVLENACVLIVGSTALEEAKNFGLCLWASEKLKKNCKYIAFYHEKKIWGMFKIKSSIIFNFEGDIPSAKDLKEKGEVELGGLYEHEISDALKRLKNSRVHKWEFKYSWKIMYFDRNENLLKSKLEHLEPGAFIQRPSYVLANSILNAKTTKDIKFLSKII